VSTPKAISSSLTTQELQQAADAVRHSPLRRQALDTLRPRGVAGFLRSHAPLRLLLQLAAREGRLVWRSPRSFAVLEAPLGESSQPIRGVRTLRHLDRYWDVWIFFLPPVVFLAVVAALAWLSPLFVPVALLLITAALTIMAVGLGAIALLQAYRLISGRRRMNETAVGQIRAMHWTVVLCHVTKPDEITDLLEAARRCGFPSSSDQTHPVLYFEEGTTSPEARVQARSDPMVQPLSDRPPVFVVASPSDPPLKIPNQPGRFLGRDVAVVLGGSALVMAILATVIPAAEKSQCPSEDCGERPTTYGDALYWVFSRVLGGDPEGLGVAHPGNRFIGLLLTFYGLFVLIGIIERVIQQQIDEDLAAGRSLAQVFNNERARLNSEPARAAPAAAPKDPPRRLNGVVLGLMLGVVVGALLGRRGNRQRIVGGK
jgi:hypothetical protein